MQEETNCKRYVPVGGSRTSGWSAFDTSSCKQDSVCMRQSEYKFQTINLTRMLLLLMLHVKNSYWWLLLAVCISLFQVLKGVWMDKMENE